MEDTFTLMDETRISKRLMETLPAFLLLQAQHETVMVNLQKVVDVLDDDNRKKVYEVVKQDLTARAKIQIANLQEQINKM